MNKKTPEKSKQCYFCYPKKGVDYLKRVYKYDAKFFGKYDNFFIMPMIGAGMEGYLLIFHKDHYHSMADISKKDIATLRKLINLIKNEISEVYGPSIVFEHGSTCDNVSCLIDHAHIHITPVPKGFDMKDEINQDFKLISIKKFKDLKYWQYGDLGPLHYKIINGELDEKTAREDFTPFSGYLYYENTSGKMFIHTLEDLYGFQPHYLRKIIFKKLGKNRWEWNKLIDPRCQDRTIEKLKNLSKYFEKVDFKGR
jgi:diadenosine tetraphosphate (Ap4A) HIT family hydrolase